MKNLEFEAGRCRTGKCKLGLDVEAMCLVQLSKYLKNVLYYELLMAQDTVHQTTTNIKSHLRFVSTHTHAQSIEALGRLTE